MQPANAAKVGAVEMARPESHLAMIAERADKPVTTPRCPRCAQPMGLTRRTQRFGALPDLYTFECITCNVSHTEERPDDRDSTALRRE